MLWVSLKRGANDKVTEDNLTLSPEQEAQEIFDEQQGKSSNVVEELAACKKRRLLANLHIIALKSPSSVYW